MSKKGESESKGDVDAVETCLEDVVAERQEYLDLVQKVQADFENYKKRADREREDSQKYANQQIVQEFLEVKDNLERALENSGNIKSIVQGVELTLKQLDALMEKHGVEEINSTGKTFDPHYHEALMFDEGDVKEETVSQVLQKGYMLHSRVVRPAKVKITKPKEE